MPIIDEYSIDNKRTVVHMNEIQKRKVVEHNDLISSVAKMDKTPLKIFELAVSCIDTENPPKNNTVYLSKTELFSFFNVMDKDKHSRFKLAIEKMQKQAYFEVKEIQGNGFRYKSIIPIPTVTWNDYNDEVEIIFNPSIMPYLIELRENFTQYAISDIMELNSKYSIILYKWFSMQYNQYEHYSANGGRRQEQLEAYKNPIVSVEELRRITDTLDSYERFAKFEAYVLKNSIEEINEFTHFNVDYSKLKSGRSIDSINFHISKKQIASDNFYKEEQKDPIYLKNKEEREQQQKNLYAEAMQNKYTSILMKNMLIGYEDFQKIDTMVNLQTVVYPLYDKLKELRGLNGVEDHLSYVANKQKGYSKTNIVKYLKQSIEGYIQTVKIQNLENQ